MSLGTIVDNKMVILLDMTWQWFNVKNNQKWNSWMINLYSALWRNRREILDLKIDFIEYSGIG
jgi:hypothetical protein